MGWARETDRHLSLHTGPQRQGVSAELLPALTAAARSGASVSSTSPRRLFEEAKLSEEERAMLRRTRLARADPYGVIFFLLEKLGAVVGTTNMHIYAAMRGQSARGFPQDAHIRRLLYSVAAQK
jgi:hypothetical protein